MKALAVLVLATFSLSSISYAGVEVIDVGSTSAGAVTRSIFSSELKACYTYTNARAGGGVKIACVHVKSIPAGLKNHERVAILPYGQVTKIVDSEVSVSCLASSNIYNGADIVCEAF